jgi:hypothetical protein
MLKVKQGDVTFKVKWHYGTESISDTNCVIYIFDEKTGKEEEKSTGIAFCAWNDQFEKNIGRKISLQRALQAFDRPDRQPFWDAYYKMHGNRW